VQKSFGNPLKVWRESLQAKYQEGLKNEKIA
jgi:hypothetical protein